MIANSVVQTCIEDLYNITKVNIVAFDGQGKELIRTGEIDVKPAHIKAFLESPADSQVIGDNHLMKVTEDEEPAYVIATCGPGEQAYNVGRIAVAQLKALQLAYQEKYDKNSFYQNLILKGCFQLA